MLIREVSAALRENLRGTSSPALFCPLDAAARITDARPSLRTSLPPSRDLPRSFRTRRYALRDFPQSLRTKRQSFPDSRFCSGTSRDHSGTVREHSVRFRNHLRRSRNEPGPPVMFDAAPGMTAPAAPEPAERSGMRTLIGLGAECIRE
jgi:hypothetical protein